MTENVYHPEKLVAIAFQKNHTSKLLEELEGVLVYTLLSELSLVTPLSCRNMATGAEHIALPDGLGMDQVYQKYTQICRSLRARYLMSGALSLRNEHDLSQLSVSIQLQVYDAEQKRFPLEITETLSTFELSNGETLPTIEAFNSLMARLIPMLIDTLALQQAGPAQTLSSLSHSYPALMMMSHAQQRSSNAEKRALYEQALQLDPALEPAYHQLAKIYRAEEQYDKSVMFYRKALEHSHACHAVKAQYATDAGIGCAILGKLDLALQWWQRAIDYKPDLINPYFNMANVYEDRGEFEKAEEYFCQAQRLAPNDFRTHFNLARIYAKMGIWDKALTQYQHQLQTDEQDPWVHSDIANVYLHLGELEKAQIHLEKTVELDDQGEAGQFARLILDGLGA